MESGLGVPPDAEAARAMYERACSRGDHLGCGNLATMLEPTDPTRAEALYRAACEAQIRSACTSLGTLLARRPATQPEAAVVLQSACDLADQLACANLAALLLTTDVMPREPTRAQVLLERACAAEVPGACFHLGVLDRQARPPRDSDAARRFEHACALGHLGACVNFGAALQSGRGVPIDPERARELFRHACAGGVDEGCRNLSGP